MDSGPTPPYDSTSGTAANNVGFPPADSLEAAEAQDKLHRVSDRTIQAWVVLVCAFSMAMLVLIPVWNAAVLLRSTVYSYMLGTWIPSAFIVGIVMMILGFLGVVVLFFQMAKPEAHTGQTLVMMGCAVLTLLGVTFMLFGKSLTVASNHAYKEVVYNCQNGDVVGPLYSESLYLYRIRETPLCAAMKSVELCVGYEDSQSAQILKHIENDFRCSTFCTAMQDGQVIPAPTESGWPTLFSDSNYLPSCQMMLARNLKYYVADIGLQGYVQGCMLCLAAALAMFLKLIGFCAPLRMPGSSKPLAAGDGYGATRYVSHGVLH